MTKYRNRKPDRSAKSILELGREKTVGAPTVVNPVVANLEPISEGDNPDTGVCHQADSECETHPSASESDSNRTRSPSQPGFCDADWANSEDRKSITGYGFELSTEGSLISWKSMKQPTVAMFTCEAEFMSLATATREGKFLQALMKDMQVCPLENSTFYCDNQEHIVVCFEKVLELRNIDAKATNPREKTVGAPTVVNPVVANLEPISEGDNPDTGVCHQADSECETHPSASESDSNVEPEESEEKRY
ncbi:hypothetical protein RRG08_054582 [Elysia crispata]|uniref:Uncharacterized protein n=1 Tax=Elysia crispata TaxID=231223 RepID=A0AAE1E870_9GAST|nr:hypothetical protein RRG08_054582 [Elysia crispata]